MQTESSRREFLSTALTGAGSLVLTGGMVHGAHAPSNTLNIALIGVGGRGKRLRGCFAGENIVAICDVDENALADATKEFPKAARYHDWRRCLGNPDVDAVVVATNDQSHAMIGIWAMNRGMHVYLEKPIAISAEEARLLRARSLANRGKLAVQLGTQRHIWENFNRVRDLVRGGAIGTLQSVQAWRNSFVECDGYLPGQGEPPSTLHYDLWLGPASPHPYHPDYFGKCSNWQKYWDFGTGTVGNWGSHVADLAWKAMDADLPLTAKGEGDPYHPEAVPSKLRLDFTLPANGWRPGIRYQWNQGGYLPEPPLPDVIDLTKMAGGVMFTGDRGVLITDFLTRMLFPMGELADLTYYRKPDPKAMRSTTEAYFRQGMSPGPAMENFCDEWIDACKNGTATSCNFDYSAPIMETLLVGVAAWRAGVAVRYDGETGRVISHAHVNDFLKKEYRDGWPLDA